MYAGGWGVSSIVMAGLVPAIHVFSSKEGVDARHEVGHDPINLSAAAWGVN